MARFVKWTQLLVDEWTNKLFRLQSQENSTLVLFDMPILCQKTEKVLFKE